MRVPLFGVILALGATVLCTSRDKVVETFAELQQPSPRVPPASQPPIIDCRQITIMVICCGGKRRCREETFVATVTTSGFQSKELYHRWKVSDGRIVEEDELTGQGRLWVRVDARKVKKWPIELSVQIEGYKNYPEGCPLEATVKVQRCKNAKTLIRVDPQ